MPEEASPEPRRRKRTRSPETGRFIGTHTKCARVLFTDGPTHVCSKSHGHVSPEHYDSDHDHRWTV
jgi:hypothetical protein